VTHQALQSWYNVKLSLCVVRVVFLYVYIRKTMDHGGNYRYVQCHNSDMHLDGRQFAPGTNQLPNHSKDQFTSISMHEFNNTHCQTALISLQQPSLLSRTVNSLC
jgi:hypothetical protein